jgi:hypothetical protein
MTWFPLESPFEGMPEPESLASRAFANGSGTPAGLKLRQTQEGPESRTENARTSGPFDLSGRRGSNPRPSAWEADALPLSYSRLRREFNHGPGPNGKDSQHCRGGLR